MVLKDNEMKLVLEVNKLFHDLTAHSYENVHPEIFFHSAKILKEFLKKHLKGYFKNVLDIGSGTGFMYRIIKETVSFKNFYMMDISKQMLKFSKRINENALYINANALKLPFKDETFDLITANSVLHHLPDVETFLSEARRTLKKGGIFLVSHEPNKYFSDNNFLWYQFVILNKLKRASSPIKLLKRWIAKLRNIRNPIYDRINEELMKKGLIEKPLSYEKLSSYIDYLSPTAGYLRKGVGVDYRLFEKYFNLIELKTYDHLGKLLDRNESKILSKYNRFLEKRFPNQGSRIVAILQR